MVQRFPNVYALPGIVQELALENDVFVIRTYRNEQSVKVIQRPAEQLVPHISPDLAVVHCLDGLVALRRRERGFAGDFWRLVGILFEEIAIDHIRISLHCPGGHCFNVVGLHPVVRINVDYIVSGGLPQAGHPGLWQSFVFLAENLCAVLALRERFQDFLDDGYGIVRTSVIDKNELDIFPGLGKQGLGALTDVLFHVVDGNYNGYFHSWYMVTTNRCRLP